MAYDSRGFRILIASPSDVQDEREIAVRLIQEWNDLNSFARKVVLLPLRWETHAAPEYGTRPQEVINRIIVDECDLLVGIFWTRIGSPTGVADSGTLAGKSARATRFSGRHSHFVSKRPIWLVEAAKPVIARSPTTQRIAGSRHSRSASFTSS